MPNTEKAPCHFPLPWWTIAIAFAIYTISYATKNEPVFNDSRQELFPVSEIRASMVREQAQTISLPPQNLTMCGAFFGVEAYSCFKDNSLENSRALQTPKPLKWNPEPHKYLFAFCVREKISNQVLCIRKYMFLSAILNRSLVLLSHGYRRHKYHYDLHVDRDHVNACLGSNRAINISQYLALENATEMSVKFHCLGGFSCGCHERYQKYLSRDSVTIINGSCHIFGVSSKEDFVRQFSSYGDKVISVGDIFGIRFSDDPLFFFPYDSAFGLLGDCRSVLRPSQNLFDASEEYVASVIKEEFMAVHIRRGDFYSHCLRLKMPNCFPSVAQLAACLAGAIEASKNSFNAMTVYVASNGEQQEINFFESSVRSLTLRPVRFVHMLARGDKVLGDLLMRHGLASSEEVLTELEKIVMARSVIFQGYSKSTFSEDVMRIRHGIKMESLYDGICANVKDRSPNFYSTASTLRTLQ